MKYLFTDITLLLFAVLALLILLFVTHALPPTYTLTFSSLSLSIFIPFFLLLFSFLFGFAGYMLKSKVQGILFGMLGVLYLLLRYYGFTHWFFVFMLLLIFILTEIIVLKTS